MRYYPYDTITNTAKAVFSDGDNAPVKDLEIAVTLVQAGTGDPSPSNVRAITGFTGLELTVEASESDPAAKVYTADFPEAAGTVYGGKLTYKGNGVWSLYVDTAGRDIGSITSMTYSASSTAFTIAKSQVVPAAKAGTSNTYVSSIFTQKPVTIGADYYIYETSSLIRIVDSDYTDADLFRTAMTGQILVYPLASPVTYDLTTDEVFTLFGDNVIFANTGNLIKLTYRINKFDYYRRVFMKNPGYVFLDGGGIDLSSAETQTITGAWNRAVTAINTKKPIWAYNTKYGSGKPLSPVPVFCWYITSTQLVIVGATLHIIVNNDDTCIVQDVASADNRAINNERTIEKEAETDIVTEPEAEPEIEPETEPVTKSKK